MVIETESRRNEDESEFEEGEMPEASCLTEDKKLVDAINELVAKSLTRSKNAITRDQERLRQSEIEVQEWEAWKTKLLHLIDSMKSDNKARDDVNKELSREKINLVEADWKSKDEATKTGRLLKESEEEKQRLASRCADNIKKVQELQEEIHKLQTDGTKRAQELQKIQMLKTNEIKNVRELQEENQKLKSEVVQQGMKIQELKKWKRDVFMTMSGVMEKYKS
ncbi:hypothetical protein NHQ30_010588 [Ciborinia camelliae]|nr:hypothetical protein NHQ30_010588 [Ciborinia camelliae]